MKRLMVAAVMSTAAFFLTACGDNAPAKPEMNTTQEQAQSGATEQQAEQAAPTEGEAAGAAAQE
ncbi:MAG: hypothetical protein ACOYKA_07325 [Legionellaceae bacterium]